MTAIFKIKTTQGHPYRMMVVENIYDESDLRAVTKSLESQYHMVVLVSAEDYLPTYSRTEVLNERGLLGSVRRYSTGTGTVTIPQ